MAKAGSRRTTESTSAQPNLDHIAVGLRSLAIAIDDLEIDPHNHNQHDANSIAKIAASLRVYGQLKPIVAQDRGKKKPLVRAGNGTLQALRLNGHSHVAALIVKQNDATAIGWAIADNQTAKYSEIDQTQLEALLQTADFGDDVELLSLRDDVEQLLQDCEADPDATVEDESEPETVADDPAKIPLAIVLTREENQRWKQFKSDGKHRTDRAAFLALFEGDEE